MDLTKFQLYVGQASQNLGSTKPFLHKDDKVVDWQDNENPPTDEALSAEIDRLEAEYNSNQYQRDRASAYPSIQDQLDMQYHDLVDGTTTWKDAISKVKSDNPKPE